MEELQAKHRKEQKDLQNRITQKKKDATKKTRKGVNDDCERLQQELKEKQQSEIAALDPSPPTDEVTGPTIGDEEQVNDEGTESQSMNGSMTGPASTSTDPTGVQQGDSLLAQSKQKKPNRQKARLARRAAERDAQAAAAAEEAASLPDLRDQELTAMRAEMKKRELVEKPIAPDGHCMYSACASTLLSEDSKNYQRIRTVTASFISEHADDFSPFLEEPIDSYVNKIKTTAEWGGHLELQAIARAYSTTINVLQSNGQVEKVLPEKDSRGEIWLAYYKHSFGLGEHYNALKKVSPS